MQEDKMRHNKNKVLHHQIDKAKTFPVNHTMMLLKNCSQVRSRSKIAQRSLVEEEMTEVQAVMKDLTKVTLKK